MQTALHPLTREDAIQLAAQSPLSELLIAATELRAQGKGTVITFSKKVFIPLTTLCRDYCSYCTFRKDPGQPGAHFMTPDEFLALAERGSAAGCKEALFSLGETMEERIDSLFAIRALHENYGHIQEVIIQNFRAKPEISMAAHPEPSLEDMLRTIALARLILGPHMNIQAPPNLSYDDFPRLLEAGINDWGGISPVTKDFINPEAAWPQIARLQSETESRGFTLRERLAIYPEYVSRVEFLSPSLRNRIAEVPGPDGFARGAAHAARI